jgi:cell division protein FtsQ
VTAPVREPTVVADPRLQARRREVRRAHGRRRLRRLQGAAGILAVLGAGWALSRSPLLDVDRLTVAGADRSGRQAVVAAAGIEPGDPMVYLDLGAASAAVETLPWVEAVTMVRRWPGEVEVTVSERRPVAVVVSASTGHLVDGRGRVLAPAPPGSWPDLPRVRGLSPLPGAGASLEAGILPVVDLARRLATVLPGPAPEVLVADGEVQAATPLAGTPTAITVRFGRPDQVPAKIEALVALVRAGAIDDVVGPATVDLRVPSAPVLTRTEG